MATVTFSGYGAGNTDVTTYTEAGFTIRALFDTGIRSTSGNGNGPPAIFSNNDGSLELVNGSTFTFSSFQGANGALNGAAGYTITGFLAGAQVFTQTYSVTGTGFVTLLSPSPATVDVVRFDLSGPSVTIDNIVANATAVTGAFSATDVTVNEGDEGSQSGQFTITRSAAAGSSLGDATIAYTIIDAGSSAQTTATFGSDYTAARSGLLTFAAGQTSVTVPFTVIGDTVAESNETFRIQLSNPSSGGTIARGVGTATIVDNDGTPPPVAPNTPGLQQGTSGNDVLISTNQGNSILAGGRGNDTYLVYSQGDVVIEAPNEGNDILYTTVSYSLGENQIEAMSVANQMTTNAVNLIGNYVSQIVVGNYGNNVLNGGGGQDTLIGLFGDDTYAVGDSRTVIQEGAGQGLDTLVTSVDYRLGAGVSIEVFAAQDRAATTGLRLSGNEFAQTIAGTAGSDTITGGAGVDTLIGGAGADTFLFETSATGNFATLVDFVAGTDRIGLARQAFAALGTTLDASEFVIGTAATAASAQIVYNQATGQLFYDADGTGFFTPTLFAQLAPGTAITAASFDVIVPTATVG